MPSQEERDRVYDPVGPVDSNYRASWKKIPGEIEALKAELAKTVHPAIEGKVNAHEAEEKMREDAVEELNLDEVIAFPVRYDAKSRHIFDAEGKSVCHLMWNTHHPRWERIDAAGQVIVDTLNARRDQPCDDRLAERKPCDECGFVLDYAVGDGPSGNDGPTCWRCTCFYWQGRHKRLAAETNDAVTQLTALRTENEKLRSRIEKLENVVVELLPDDEQCTECRHDKAYHCTTDGGTDTIGECWREMAKQYCPCKCFSPEALAANSKEVEGKGK